MTLDRDAFAAVVRDTPLVSIDLIVRDPAGRVLVGRRTNQPARGCWFVPGGRIRKDERIADAFTRIARDELGIERTVDDAAFRGVFEHLYDTNFAGIGGFGTHYVVLAYDVGLPEPPADLPVDQHSDYRWACPAELLSDPDVHANTKAYFTSAADQP